MDTTLAVIKRIEQQLIQLQRELRRNGFDLPNESFVVHTGDRVAIEIIEDSERIKTRLHSPAPVPVEKTKAEVVEGFRQGFSEVITGNTIPASELRTELDKLDEDEQKPPRKMSK